MSKTTRTTPNTTTDPLIGVDISKGWFDAAAADGRTRRFPNDADGHCAFLAWARKGARVTATARVVMEATGTYGLDLALALHAHAHCEVMVANPRLIRGFAQATAQRQKTDAADARTILAFAERMPFVPWAPPSAALLELRAIARRIDALTVERTREKNRLKALRASASHSRLVANDVAVNIRHLTRRMKRLLQQALAVIDGEAGLSAAYGLLTSVKGIGARSAVALMAELLVLPADMTAKEWVAYGGLDPREHTSGSSVHGRVRISKVGSVPLRRALYMPAVVASRSEPRVRAYYEELRARGKGAVVAYVAVMRKLLHALHGMLKHGAAFDGERFRATPKGAATP